MNPFAVAGAAAVEDTLRELQNLGQGQTETATFWLGRPDDNLIRTIVIPAGPGVRFHPFSIRLSEGWMIALDQLCLDRDQVVLAAVHTHPERAFFSGIDEDGFFHAPDCVSIVLPNYARTSLAAAETDWAVFVGLPFGSWRPARWSEAIAVIDAAAHEVVLLSSAR